MTHEDLNNFFGFTAQMMAAARAIETEKAYRLFNDPLASRLATGTAFAYVKEKLTEQDIAYIAVRTRFFDDFLFSPEIKAKQVVILASGLDTRAYRLPWSSDITIYELDEPQVLKSKTTILREFTPNCQHHLLGVDLTQPWSDLLLAKGFQPNLPSVWLLEGLLMYLTQTEVLRLLQTIGTLTAADSYLGLDLVNVKSIEYKPYKGYWYSGFDSPEELLTQYGWRIAQVLEPGQEGANFGRYSWVLPPRDVPDVERVFLVQARK